MNRILLWIFGVIVLVILIAGAFIYSDCILFACPTCTISRAGATAYATFVGGLLSGFSVIFLLLNLDYQKRQAQKDAITQRFTLMLESYKKTIEEMHMIIPASNSVITGRKVIDHIVDDFVEIFETVKDFKEREENYAVNEQAHDLKLAFGLLYFGFTEYGIDKIWNRENITGEKILGTAPPDDFLERLEVSELELERFGAYLYRSSMTGINNEKEKYRLWKSSFYANFGGYHNYLGHYLRQLFNMIEYINKQKLFARKEKYELVKMLRTQLTNNEQKLIFLNAFFKYGWDWEFKFRAVTQPESKLSAAARNNLLISKYQLIKNLSRQEVFKDIKPGTFFPDVNFEDPKESHALKI